jgi:hypothetical protein
LPAGNVGAGGAAVHEDVAAMLLRDREESAPGRARRQADERVERQGRADQSQILMRAREFLAAAAT